LGNVKFGGAVGEGKRKIIGAGKNNLGVDVDVDFKRNPKFSGILKKRAVGIIQGNKEGGRVPAFKDGNKFVVTAFGDDAGSVINGDF